ncbi:AAA family ATPase [Roseovarius sp. ZX-A-9]|uniref:AAA family ATPase n=1 Tax=Roseovarius sp. ZX-A-9 TaxID=3014783 RepID=UPI00232AF2C0|nr:ATP-binding protein [Roseovarius sp. ZX-A-9]
MPDTLPTLHMLCGKIAAGKSTLATRLADLPQTVRITEDDWLKALFADELNSLSDYKRCSAQLRQIMAPHIAALLNARVSVVLDFPANTVEQRRWMRGVIEMSKAAHYLHVLNVPDDVCLARLRRRRLQGDHPFSVTEAQFRQFSRHFSSPSPDESFNVIWHEGGG